MSERIHVAPGLFAETKDGARLMSDGLWHEKFR